MTPLEVIVLTGFLGSGKTSLLRDFIASPAGAGTGVIVNEAGEVGLDGAILQEGGGALNLAMLANGCICCSMGSDLIGTVHGLLEAGPVARIVLETSGLSRPGPVLRQLAGVPGVPMRVSVVATFDAVRGLEVAAFGEAAAQWAAAHRIVATRMDLAASGPAAEIGRAIGGVNPLAEVMATEDRRAAVAGAFAPLAAVGAMAAPELGAGHPVIGVRLVRPLAGLAYGDLAAWLDNLAGLFGERLLRVKGVVRVAEEGAPLLVQSVGTMFARPRAFSGEVGRDFLVVMVRDLRLGELEAVEPGGAFMVEPPSPGPFGRARRSGARVGR